MKRLVFLVEGNPDEVRNFSGIPHFLTRALRESLGAVPAARRPAGVEALYREMEREALGGVPRIFCFSEALRLDLHRRHRVALENLTVAYPGGNLEAFPEPIERAAHEPFQLLF